MSRNEKFAKCLSAAMESQGETAKKLADELRIDYKRLRRWMSRGIGRPTNKTAPDLEKLRRRLGFASVGELWGPSPIERESPRRPPAAIEPPPALEFWEQAIQLFEGESPWQVHQQMGDVLAMLTQLKQTVPALWAEFAKTDLFERYWILFSEYRNGVPLERHKARVL